MKTAVLRHVRGRQAALGVERLPDDEIAGLCASFQRTVVQTAARRGPSRRPAGTARARSASPAASRPTAGCGPSSRQRGRAAGLPVFVPPLALATDNAAMIAAAGVRLVEAGRFADAGLNAVPSLALG